jgi:hypothetical protein
LLNHKNFVLEKELTGGCYHRRANAQDSHPGFRRYSLLPPYMPQPQKQPRLYLGYCITIIRYIATAFTRFRQQSTACRPDREIITVRLPGRLLCDPTTLATTLVA